MDTSRIHAVLSLNAVTPLPNSEPASSGSVNWYGRQKILVNRDAAPFNTHLTTRMELLAQHFTLGGTQTPAAIIDIHGLALCRLARGRAIEPVAEQVYLPMGLLDC